MDAVGVALLASGLALDSCLVALAQGVAAREHRWRRALELACVFGLLQSAFAVGGWFIGAPIADTLGAFDHWIAFAVLSAIGVRTIRAAHVGDARAIELSTAGVFVAGVATSIDALAAGFSLELAGESIAPTAIATGAITALGSLLAYFGGRSLGARWKRAAHWVAGLVLIAIGAQIVYTHAQ